MKKHLIPFYTQGFESGIMPVGWNEWNNPNAPSKFPASWNCRDNPIAGNVSALFAKGDPSLAIGAVYFFDQKFGGKTVSSNSLLVKFGFKCLARPTTGPTEVIDLLNWPNELSQVYMQPDGQLLFHGGSDVLLTPVVPLNQTVNFWVRWKNLVPTLGHDEASCAWSLGDTEPTSGDYFAIDTSSQRNLPVDSFLFGPTDTADGRFMFDSVELFNT